MITGFDTSAVVACLCPWHESHESALALLASSLAHKGRVVIAAHSVIELYATLTRLPSPHRFSAAEAAALIGANVPRPWVPVSVDASTALPLVVSCAGRSPPIQGGRTYDALIASALVAGGARRVVTLNLRHFEGLEPTLAVVSPD